MTETVILPDETAPEHVRNALQLLHNYCTYELTSADYVRHETTLKAIAARLTAALAKIEQR